MRHRAFQVYGAALFSLPNLVRYMKFRLFSSGGVICIRRFAAYFPTQGTFLFKHDPNKMNNFQVHKLCVG